MIEMTPLLVKEYKFFLYWIVWWLVIYYFEKERIGWALIAKLFVFWVIAQFSNNAVTWFNIVDITNENQIIVATMTIATTIQLFLQYISTDKHGEKIIEWILRRLWIFK